MSVIDVQIEKLVYGGAGLARTDQGAALVPFTLPGETLSAEVTRKTGNMRHAYPIAWREQSPERVAAPCPVFMDCGGCHYQHIPYEKQLEYKEAILRETLARLGKIEWDGPVRVVAGEPWGYRNRTQLRIAHQGRRSEVGFLAMGSHELIPATDCPINSPKLNQAHIALREMARERRFPDFLHEVEFFTNERDVQLNAHGERPLAKRFFAWAGEKIPGLLPGEYLEYPVGDDVYRVGSRSFFQVNRFLIEELTEAAVGDARGGTALDLYSGVGLLTVPLARRFERTIGVDSSGAAMRSLQYNAQRAGVEVKAIHMNVDAYLRNFSEPVDLVVADPPRGGVGTAVVEDLLRLRPAAISLVSCDPSTLARDLKTLTAGGYQIESLTMLDLFPQTFHLETVAWLRRS